MREECFPEVLLQHIKNLFITFKFLHNVRSKCTLLAVFLFILHFYSSSQTFYGYTQHSEEVEKMHKLPLYKWSKLKIFDTCLSKSAFVLVFSRFCQSLEHKSGNYIFRKCLPPLFQLFDSAENETYQKRISMRKKGDDKLITFIVQKKKKNCMLRKIKSFIPETF